MSKLEGYESRGTNIQKWWSTRKRRIGRIDYFAGKALQGLVTGKAEGDLKYVVSRSVKLAKEMVDELDS